MIGAGAQPIRLLSPFPLEHPEDPAGALFPQLQDMLRIPQVIVKDVRVVACKCADHLSDRQLLWDRPFGQELGGSNAPDFGTSEASTGRDSG